MKNKLINLLIEKKLHISTAESCTGGLISAAITAVSGSSEIFDEGICTYANEAKMKHLNVPFETLEKYSPVFLSTFF